MGIFRLGFIAAYLSDCVVDGFTSGAAVVVVTAQLDYLLGVRLPPYSGPGKVFVVSPCPLMNSPRGLTPRFSDLRQPIPQHHRRQYSNSHHNDRLRRLSFASQRASESFRTTPFASAHTGRATGGHHRYDRLLLLPVPKDLQSCRCWNDPFRIPNPASCPIRYHERALFGYLVGDDRQLFVIDFASEADGEEE